MEQLPAYINLFFILTTVIALVLFYQFTKNLRSIAVVVFWLALQGIISLTGFYTVATGVPPRFVLLLLPPVIFIAVLFFTKAGKQSMNGYNLKYLTLFHIVRIPVELTLYWLYVHKAVPEIMTFEGRNFDILCGLTAPTGRDLSIPSFELWICDPVLTNKGAFYQPQQGYFHPI